MTRALAAVAAAIMMFSAASSAEPVYRVETEQKVVAITFDDGPHPKKTAKILAVLEKYGAAATFFVVGKNAEYYPDVICEVVSAGHEVANHTYSHATLGRCGADKIEREILSAEESILCACGAKTKLLRPPEGSCSREVMNVASRLGYSVILWNIDTRDWAHKGAEEIVENVKKNVRPGSIILFHDYTVGENHTVDALEKVLCYLSEEGYGFVTVGELIG